MSEQHYFSETPETEFKPRPVQVELAGRKVTVTTANGIFSPSGIDKGTAILLQEAPEPRGERLLDIGCGWGPITLTLAMLAPQAQVHAVDVNSRSISLTERNAAALGLPNVTVGTPDSVDPELRFDTIWSNPPIRVGKEVLHPPPPPLSHPRGPLTPPYNSLGGVFFSPQPKHPPPLFYIKSLRAPVPGQYLSSFP